MVKHIVLFKLKETLSPAEKADIMNRFKTAIEALPATIPFIRDIHVGLNETRQKYGTSAWTAVSIRWTT